MQNKSIKDKGDKISYSRVVRERLGSKEFYPLFCASFVGAQERWKVEKVL